MLEEVDRKEGTPVIPGGAAALSHPAPSRGGVYQQTGFTDISEVTPPDPVCTACCSPVWDSAPTACVWVAAQDANIEDSRSSSYPFLCAPVHPGLQTWPLRGHPSIPLKHCAQLRIAPKLRIAPTLAGQVTGPPLVRAVSQNQTLQHSEQQPLEPNGCLNRLVMQRASVCGGS